MACNWLRMISSGDDIWPSGSTGLLTNKKTKTRSFKKTHNRALLTLGHDSQSVPGEIFARAHFHLIAEAQTSLRAVRR